MNTTLIKNPSFLEVSSSNLNHFVADPSFIIPKNEQQKNFGIVQSLRNVLNVLQKPNSFVGDINAFPIITSTQLEWEFKDMPSVISNVYFLPVSSASELFLAFQEEGIELYNKNEITDFLQAKAMLISILGEIPKTITKYFGKRDISVSFLSDPESEGDGGAILVTIKTVPKKYAEDSASLRKLMQEWLLPTAKEHFTSLNIDIGL